MVKFSYLILVVGTLASSASHACRLPPREQVVTPEELLALATDVTLAKVIRATPSPIRNSGGRPSVEYEFEVQERLLGPEEQRFVLIGASGKTRPNPSSNDHSDKTFWERGGGRLYNDPDCVLRPNFAVGENYLVFRGQPATWRSFEHIETVRGKPDTDDKWLSYAKDKLESLRR
ncbi:MAG: hypothetical protein RR775_17720 [Massilia sp.]